MADDDVELGPLSRKVGPLPIYGWVMILGGVALIGFKLLKGNAAAGNGSGSNTPDQFSSSQQSTSTNPATGATTSSSFTASGDSFLPGELTTQGQPMPYSAGDIYVNVSGTGQTPAPPTNTTTPAQPSPLTNVNMPDTRDASGRDVGQYRFGADEVEYLKQNVGNFGITQDLVNQVQAYYNNIAANYGADVANNYHYVWANGGVSVVPEYTASGGAVVYPKASTTTSTQQSPSPVVDATGAPTFNVPANPANPGGGQQFAAGPVGQTVTSTTPGTAGQTSAASAATMGSRGA